MRDVLRGGFCIAVLALATCTAPATASVTVGQVAPGFATGCSNSFEFLQASAPDNAYAMPAAGVITSWSHHSQAGNGQTPTLKIYRKIGEPANYQVIGHDGPEPILANETKAFPASIPVQAGDVLGITGAGGAVNISCSFTGPGTEGNRMSNLVDGGFGDFTIGGPNNRLNVSAVLNPTSTFTLDAVKRNKKKGTGLLTATVPNPGVLIVTGPGVRSATVTATAAGPVSLPIKARGAKKKALTRSGEAKVTLAVTYTPTGGDPNTRPRKLKLSKKH
jgi:hypothetical protein